MLRENNLGEMKKVFMICNEFRVYAVIIVICGILTGCSGTVNSNNERQAESMQLENFDMNESDSGTNVETMVSAENTILPENMTSEECVKSGEPTEDTENKPSVSFSSDITLYQLLGLSIGDSEERVLELYGEPDGRCYEVVGTYPLQDQSLYTYLIYEDKMIVVRKFFDDTGTYDNQNGVVEIEVSGEEYVTTRGIKIGDSVEDVMEKYEIEYVYNYGEEDGLVSTLIYNRAEGIKDIMNREFLYEYGKFDKVAYVLSDEKFEKHCNIPAITFLISDGKVTKMIVMNTVDF